MPAPLRAWLRAATPTLAARLAKLAKTSVKTLQNMAAGHRGGSAEAAVRISKASAILVLKGEATHAIDQASICPACRQCPHYQRANTDEKA